MRAETPVKSLAVVVKLRKWLFKPESARLKAGLNLTVRRYRRSQQLFYNSFSTQQTPAVVAAVALNRGTSAVTSVK